MEWFGCLKSLISFLHSISSNYWTHCTNFLFLKKLWSYVGGRIKQKLGFVKLVDKDRITTVTDLESFSSLSRW